MKRLLLINAMVFVMLSGCKHASNAPSASLTPTPTAHSISGQIMAPQGPVRDARVMLLTYMEEACVKLEEKKDRSEEDKKKLSECRKLLSEIKTNENGEYNFGDVKPGWYRLDMGWQVALKSDVENGADLTGPYRTYYGRLKDAPEKFGIAAIGFPFRFDATGNVAKDLVYSKDREPYKSAK